MSIPVAIKLTSVKTGEEHTFGSIAQAAEWLQRSKCYFDWRIKEKNSDHVTGAWGEEFVMEKIGLGKRRDYYFKTDHPKKRPNPLPPCCQMVPQLCIHCARAVGFCLWSAWLEPVPGWDAVETKNGSDGVTSYRIKACPEYIQDAPTPEGRMMQRKMLMEELEHENRREGKPRAAGCAASAPACKRCDPRAIAQALAEAVAGASDQRERAEC